MADPLTGPRPEPRTPDTAFVLGGGGMLGGYQVGMLRALLERDIKPDLVIGTSVGSIQGAILAADPNLSVVAALTDFWHDALTHKIMSVSPRALLANLARLRPAVASQDALRGVLEHHVGAHTRIESLVVPFQCAAASIERSTARYFDYGPLVPALLASSCVPGLWPPVRLGDEHYIDGGVVETVPFTRAVSYGAKHIYVLRLRQRELSLRAPRWPWQVGQTVFEVSRRHRLGQVINMRPDGVTVHLLPTGEEFLEPPDTGLLTSVKEQIEVMGRRIEAGYRSTREYLDATDERKTATIRAKTRVGDRATRSWHNMPGAHGRRSARDLELSAGPKPASAFVQAKLSRFFDLFDSDGDGRISSRDYADSANRVCAAFGHGPDSQAGTALHQAFGTFWTVLCQAAGTEPPAELDRPAFAEALHRLSADPADYDTSLLPAVAAVLGAADRDRDSVLNPAELHTLLTALGVEDGDTRRVALRLDTNNDGVLSLDELDEAFRDFFTSEEPGAVGNMLFGSSTST